MDPKNKNIFESFEEEEKISTEIKNKPKLETLFDGKNVDELANEILAEQDTKKEDKLKEPEYQFGEFSEEKNYEIILNEKLDDKGITEKVFEISKAELLKPRTIDNEGNIIPLRSLSKSDETKKGYETKVAIYFKDTNYRALLPNIKWFLNTRISKDENGNDIKVQSLTPTFRTKIAAEELDDTFTSIISKHYYIFCKTFGHIPGELTKKQFLEDLVGKKVKLKQFSGKYEGHTWNRIHIAEYVK